MHAAEMEMDLPWRGDNKQIKYHNYVVVGNGGDETGQH